MHPLDRKVIRDLWHMRGQALAICLVIASGMAAFVMVRSTLESLTITQATYYQQYRFADVFANLKRAPESLADRIAELPGVSQVQTRVVLDVTLDVADLPEPAVGRLISLPERGTPLLNQLHLRQGRYPEPGVASEVLVSDAFASAHGLGLGDEVAAIINGRYDRLRIVGLALSPEYILQMREGEILPDPIRFGVFWMNREELAAAYDMEGAFNNVTLSLSPDAVEADVLRRLDTLIEPYGGVGSYGREDQLSHRYVSDEIRALRAMGLIAPSIFLSVAAFLLNMVMLRLIGTQREQIAALKAFGYTKVEIGVHYFKLVLVIVVFGAAIGTGLGAWMGRGLTQIYIQLYHFPVFHYRLGFSVVLLAIAVSSVAAAVGTLGAIRRAVQLPPAEAMRPEPPATFRPTIIERMGLQRFVSESARMVIRQLERTPIKSLFSCLGLALAVAVLVLGRFGMDAVDYMMDFQFVRSQRQDLNVAMIEPTASRVLHEFDALPGVVQVEPFRTVAARLRHGHRDRRVGIMGLPARGELYRLLDAERNEQVTLPPDGLVLSDKLAELLDVQVGDTLTVEVQEGQRPTVQVRVSALIADYAGTNAYMHIDALRTLMREGTTVSGAFLSVDPARMDELYAELKERPRVAAVTVKEAMVQSFEDTIAENQRQLQSFNIIFAVVIAFGVVYNTVRISLAERSRELATLRVIGFTRGEVSAILLGELAVLTLLAIPLGLIMGYGFAAMASVALDTEMYRIPLVVDRATYGFAALIVLIASTVSGLIVRRQLDHLDLVSVLKARE